MSLRTEKQKEPDKNLTLFNGKCKEARNFLNQAINTPNYKPLLMKAVDSYSEAIVSNPSSSEPYLALASICWQFGKPAEARGLLNQLLGFQPENKRALRMLKAVDRQLSSHKTGKTETPEKDLKKVNQFNFDITRKPGR